MLGRDVESVIRSDEMIYTSLFESIYTNLEVGLSGLESITVTSSIICQGALRRIFGYRGRRDIQSETGENLGK